MSNATATGRRLDSVRAALQSYGIDLLLAAPSADLVYLAGMGGHASERPTLLAVPARGGSLVLVPGFEAARLPDLPGVRVVPWGETDDPYQVLRDALPDLGSAPLVAVSDQAWAAVLLRLQAALPGARFVPASGVLRELRMRKSEQELDALRRAGAMADRAFERILERPFEGRTERELGDELNALLREEGLRTADWGPIVGSGPHSASPHHLTGSRRIQSGDAVVLDFGGVLDGYQADTTRTVHVGKPDDDFRHVYEVVRQAQETAVRSVRAGVEAQAVDAAARGVIDAAGYGDFFTHRTGHGIGLDGHEEPYIIAGNALALEPGMTFSIEPGVYIPGRFGVRIEDIVAVTDAGAERFNNSSRELVIVR